MKTHALTFATALGLFSYGAHATVTTTASLTQQQPVGGTVTTIAIQGITAPSSAPFATSAYSVSFAVPVGQGIVHGALASQYAIPVAGTAGTAPTYLTGDYGSSTTTNAAASGDYFSTGVGSITITFSTLQNAIALLWGSIDTTNSLVFLDADGAVLDTLTGSAVQQAAAGFVGNGFQGPGGSAYVAATESSAFKSVVFTSSTPSFEFAAVAGSTTRFALPEPVSLTLFGSSLALAGLVRARRLA